jgi:hypothetical protein
MMRFAAVLVQAVNWAGVAILLGDSVILSAAKNLAGIAEILRCARNDWFARISCRTQLGLSAYGVVCELTMVRQTATLMGEGSVVNSVYVETTIVSLWKTRAAVARNFARPTSCWRPFDE